MTAARFTVHVVEHELVADHPVAAQQRRLAQVVGGLPAGYALAYCTGPLCSWFVRRPLRLGDAGAVAYQHIVTAHFGDLLAGRACVDPDLVDGGWEYLRARMAMVPARLRAYLGDVA